MQSLRYPLIADPCPPTNVNFCQGGSTEEVTEQLYISPATLRTHLRNIYQKTQVASRMELVSRVMQLVVHKLYEAQIQWPGPRPSTLRQWSDQNV